MISTDRDFGSCGKGGTAENAGASQATAFGHGENISVTVTLFWVLCYWIFGSSGHGI